MESGAFEKWWKENKFRFPVVSILVEDIWQAGRAALVEECISKSYSPFPRHFPDDKVISIEELKELADIK